MSIIISVSGPQNSGKTTLVNKLKESGLFYVEPKSYRDLIKEKGLSINQNGTFENQMLIMKFMVDQLDELYKSNYEVVILDRSILDCYVYSKYLFYNKKLTFDEFKQLSELYCNNVRKLYGIIHLSYNNKIKLVDDQLRDIDLEYILIINEIFRECIASYSDMGGDYDDYYRVMNLLSDNIDEKVKLSIDFIKSCGNMP